MSNGLQPSLRHRAWTFVLLLSVTTLGPAAFAQNTQPGHPAPPSWQGKPAGIPPHGATTQGMPPAGIPPAAIHPLPESASIPGRKTPAGEQFFIVASVDLQKSQLLLKYPTEVTLLMRVDDSTKFTDDSGKPLKLSDFRAGDTVWVASTNNKGDVTALRVRKGRMDVADLHRYYLDYSEIK
jgi:hypothetical protein